MRVREKKKLLYREVKYFAEDYIPGTYYVKFTFNLPNFKSLLWNIHQPFLLSFDLCVRQYPYFYKSNGENEFHFYPCRKSIRTKKIKSDSICSPPTISLQICSFSCFIFRIFFFSFPFLVFF